MKKILSSLLLASASVMAFGQIMVSENFNTLTAGNLGTDTTGATAGQNSWYTLNGTNASYQVATIDAAHGQSLTLTSGNGYTAGSNPNNRIAARLTTVTATAGNNIVQAKADIYTGSSTGAGEYRFSLIGTSGTSTVTIGGFTFNVATRKLNGLGTFYNAADVPTLYLAFADATAPVIPANTWVTVTFTYNKTTGAMSWAWPGGGGSISTDPDQITGMIAEDLYLQNLTSTGNTANNTVGFDNILAQFGNNSTLSVSDVNTVEASKRNISVYPNPTSDVLNIKTDSKINAVSVVDLTGKNVNVRLDGDKVDVRSLPAGAYLINVETEDGISTEKFIKK